MAYIFISYRRQDTVQIAMRIHDHLSIRFGDENVFLDVVKLPRHKGEDFRRHIESEIRSCSVFLAIIGGTWLNIKDDEGQRRLENPDDPVRYELELALSLAAEERMLPLVIPVLINKAAMPKPRHLPENLRALTFKQAALVREDFHDFYRDMKELIESIPSPSPEQPLPAPDPALEQWADVPPPEIPVHELAERQAEQVAAPISHLLPPVWLLALAGLITAGLAVLAAVREFSGPQIPVSTPAPTLAIIITLPPALPTAAGTIAPTAFEWIPEQPLLIRNAQTAWLRTRPDSAAPVVTIFTDNTVMVVVEGPVFDGLQWWWKVRTQDGRFRGWLEQYQLQEYAPRPDEVMLVTATASPAASPTP